MASPALRCSIAVLHQQVLYQQAASGLCCRRRRLQTTMPSPAPLPNAGLNRLAHFLALDTFDHGGTIMRSAVYFIMYYSFASPRWCLAGPGWAALGWRNAGLGSAGLGWAGLRRAGNWVATVHCRAVIWQMLLVSIGITYCCTGVAYLLSQASPSWLAAP